MDAERLCPQCGEEFWRRQGEFNRADRAGLKVYCGRECAGFGRRKNKTAAEKLVEKAKYDADRRERMADILKAEKAEHHRRTYDPAKAAIVRKARMPKHVEYCRRPEYKAKKQAYDVQRRAAEFGEFAECYLLMLTIRDECLKIQTDYEIRQSAGTLCKTTKRRRDYERSFGNKPEIGALGNPSGP